MAVCHICKRRYLLRGLNRRLAIPEYRAVIGFWPWVPVRVCDRCVKAYDRNFRERLALLAPDVLENDEPIVQRVCLVCAAVDTDRLWAEASKWVDGAGRPARRARFYLCLEHATRPYADGLVVATNLTGTEAMAAVIEELPVAGGDLLARIEGWRPPSGRGPAGAVDFMPERGRLETVDAATRFWQDTPGGLEAKAAWLGPIRKDYRMRYRLDLVRESVGGRRETFSVVRTAPERFATYVARSPAARG
jgi:hypothetical protein